MISLNLESVRKIYPELRVVNNTSSTTIKSSEAKREAATNLILTTDLDSWEIAEKAGCSESLISRLKRELNCDNSKSTALKNTFKAKKELARDVLVKDCDISCIRLGEVIGTSHATAQRYKKLFMVGEL